MGDRLQAGKLSRYVTSHPCQLSLAIPPWVGAMSTSLGWEGKGKGMCIYIALIFVVHARRSGMDHTVLPAVTPMPASTS